MKGQPSDYKHRCWRGRGVKPVSNPWTPNPWNPRETPPPGWWQASDGAWYPPETHAQYRAPRQPSPPPASIILAVVGLVLGLLTVYFYSNWQDFHSGLGQFARAVDRRAQIAMLIDGGATIVFGIGTVVCFMTSYRLWKPKQDR
jgi:hypothetical protein